MTDETFATPVFLELETLDRCPGCGSAALHEKHASDVAQCEACELLFRNPRPTQSEIARSYDTGGTFAVWQEEETARAAMWERRLAMLCKYKNQGRLLDVGTGDGRFLRVCRDAGFSVEGTEVSSAGAAYAQRQGFEVKMGQFTAIDLPGSSFDAITIWHVLEHVPDPAAVLRKAHSLLRADGVLIVAVPNEENFFVRRRLGLSETSNPFAPLIFGGEIHLTYFRPSSLLSTLRSAGFEVLYFGVDDIYSARNATMHLKLTLQRWLARLLHWHFGVAMFAVGRRQT